MTLRPGWRPKFEKELPPRYLLQNERVTYHGVPGTITQTQGSYKWVNGEMGWLVTFVPDDGSRPTVTGEHNFKRIEVDAE